MGGKENNKHGGKKLRAGRSTVGKQPVIGVRQREGRTVAAAVDGENAETVNCLATMNVEAGATVCTDEAQSYQPLAQQGYDHLSVNHSVKEFVNANAMAHTNGIESVWAVLKRGFNRVYHNWSQKHCQWYLNEFTFRLKGNCEADTLDRIKTVLRLRSATHKRLTYTRLIGTGA